MSVGQEAHHRGYRIEGQKHGEGMLIRVSPTRPDLPELKYSRFRTIQAPWAKAVCDVVRYIDGEIACRNSHAHDHYRADPALSYEKTRPNPVRQEEKETLRKLGDKLKLLGNELLAETPTVSRENNKSNLVTLHFPKRPLPPPR